MENSESGNCNNQQQSNDECLCINNNNLSSDLNSKCQGVYSLWILYETYNTHRALSIITYLYIAWL